MNKLVVHTAVGRLLKGHANDFSPMRSTFHLRLDDPAGEIVEVHLKNLKAVFFVRDFFGDPAYRESRDFSKAPAYGKRIKVTFEDGEVFFGTSEGIHRNRIGFFISPADPGVNTIRAFVINESIAVIEEITT